MKGKKKLYFTIAIICVILGFIFIFVYKKDSNLKKYEDKISLMQSYLDLFGGEEEQIVFISICNKKERASVFKGIGITVEEALNDANEKAKTFSMVSSSYFFVPINMMQYGLKLML